VAAHDGSSACLALAPRTRTELEQSTGKPCEQGLFDEDVPAVSAAETVSVFGTMAQVRYGNETTFLTRFQSGWKVLAAGCTPTTAGRFDCQISGG
jgi:hypothetical protein